MAKMGKATLSFTSESAGPGGSIWVLRPKGQVQTETADRLESEFQGPAVRAAKRVLVDLTEVDYVSSAGWGLFIAQLRTQRERAGDLRLCALRAPVREIFEMLQFQSVLQSYPGRDEAIASWGDEPDAPRGRKGLH